MTSTPGPMQSFFTGNPDWWQDFFAGTTLDFVRDFYESSDVMPESLFVEHALGLARGARVLDVPCGAGRWAVHFAARGYDVTGVDFSRQLLAMAEQAAADRLWWDSYAPRTGSDGALPVAWEQCDMRRLPWKAEFDAALCVWNSFGYFDEDGNAEFLKAVSRALKPGGRFLLDTPIMETYVAEMEARDKDWWQTREGLIALEERWYDHTTSRAESQWTFINDGKVERKRLSVRLYTYRELAVLLEQAGFGNHQAYSSAFGDMERSHEWEWDPFELGSPALCMVTTKLTDPK